MIREYDDFSLLPKRDIPFLVLGTSNLEHEDLTLRTADEKWTTIRFIVTAGSKKYRVKEFFMDWFFTGFPKSLFRDFSSSYSKVESFSIHHTTFFYGKNYKGHDSVSGYYLGTQIEIECDLSSTISEFRTVVKDLFTGNTDAQHLTTLQFPDRSYFTRGPAGDWYEEERISRLGWIRTPREEYSVSGHKMRTSGAGQIKVNGKMQSILILEEDNFRNVIWAEFSDKCIKLKNAAYDVRIGSGFYDKSVEMKNGIVILRQPDGPGILQAENRGITVTVGFSPGFTENDVVPFSEKIESFCSFAQGVLVNAHQDIA